MDINVQVDAKQINETISKAIAESAIGKELKRVIDAEVKRLSTSYNNPIENVVRQEINNVIQSVIHEEYGETIKSLVKELVSEKFTTALFTKLWESFENRY